MWAASSSYIYLLNKAPLSLTPHDPVIPFSDLPLFHFLCYKNVTNQVLRSITILSPFILNRMSNKRRNLNIQETSFAMFQVTSKNWQTSYIH